MERNQVEMLSWKVQKPQWKIPKEGQRRFEQTKEPVYSKDMLIEMSEEQKRWTQMNREPRRLMDQK